MRVILTSIVLAAAMALAAGLGLNWSQQPIYQTQPVPSVRIGDPGTNLVGQSWSGNPQPSREPATPTTPSVRNDSPQAL